MCWENSRAYIIFTEHTTDRNLSTTSFLCGPWTSQPHPSFGLHYHWQFHNPQIYTLCPTKSRVLHICASPNRVLCFSTSFEHPGLKKPWNVHSDSNRSPTTGQGRRIFKAIFSFRPILHLADSVYARVVRVCVWLSNFLSIDWRRIHYFNALSTWKNKGSIESGRAYSQATSCRVLEHRPLGNPLQLTLFKLRTSHNFPSLHLINLRSHNHPKGQLLRTGGG